MIRGTGLDGAGGTRVGADRTSGALVVSEGDGSGVLGCAGACFCAVFWSIWTLWCVWVVCSGSGISASTKVVHVSFFSG